MKKKFSLDIITSWVFFAFSIYGLILVRSSYPNVEKGYPTVVFGIMLAFSAAILIKHYHGRIKSKGDTAEGIIAAEKEKSENAASSKGISAETKRTLITMAATIAYILLLNVLGFIIDSLVFAIVLPLLLGYKKIIPIAATGIICIIFVYFLFNRLYIPIPSGLLSFLE